MGEHGKEVEASTSLNELHGRLVDLSEEYLHYDIADGYSDFEGFSAYARTCLIEIPGQVASYLYLLADEAEDERLRNLADDIKSFQLSRTQKDTLADKAASCIAASKSVNTATLRPLPARTAEVRS